MNITSPLLLLLGGADPQQGSRCIKQAQARGLKVWLTDTAENLEQAPEVVTAADRVTPLSYQDPAACVAWAVEQARSETFIGVFGFREYSVEAVNAVAQALGLPGNALEAVRTVRNKFTCRQMLRKCGFRQPMAERCSNMREAREFAAAYPPGPWIVKPPAALGSVGVSLVRDLPDWESAMAHLTSANACLAESLEQQGIVPANLDDTSFLVECFQCGEEFSVEGFFVYGHPHVLAITAKLTTGAPHFVEVGQTMPAELDAGGAQVIEHAVITALQALHLSWGIFHVELWLEEGQPVLGEVHVRPGGDCIHYMTEHVTGIELYGAIFDQLLKRPLNVADWRPCRGAAMRYLTPSPGRVTVIRGWREAIADTHCLTAELNLREGDRVYPLRSYLDRSSFIVTTAETAHIAARMAERLCNMVEVEVGGEDAGAD